MTRVSQRDLGLAASTEQTILANNHNSRKLRLNASHLMMMMMKTFGPWNRSHHYAKFLTVSDHNFLSNLAENVQTHSAEIGRNNKQKMQTMPLETRYSTMAVLPSDIASISEECLFLFTASMLHLPCNSKKKLCCDHKYHDICAIVIKILL